MVEELLKKEKKLAVIGLGYVGLPIALEFAKKIKVIGFDINKSRIELMKKGIDPNNEMKKSDFKNKDIIFTANPDKIKDASFYIVAVPTPIDEHKLPDLKALLSATETVGKVLKKGDYVVFESTVYPGCTEEDCVPVLEKTSSLKLNKDFKVGYSPERINPGDKKHNISNIIKVVSGSDEEALKVISEVYGIIVKAGIFKAANIKTAEAAKVIENTQRDVNIALMNELSIIFGRMNINTYDVLEAAGTKWNFLKFYPGLVGGHCIGVDPYYLSFKAKEYNYHPHIIDAGRFINDSMGAYIAKQTVKRIISNKKKIFNSNVLIMGVTFKENVSDIRNSKVIDIINELKSYKVNVDVVDPYASCEELKREYGIELTKKINNNYDAVIVAVKHKEYENLNEEYFKSITNNSKSLLVDVKGIYKNKINKLQYWSL